eukprot:GHVO01007096.1.p2 GENE.GHVO01007096.1~~GHVO01007096.1.p2  ORF type:complete len:113 (-),score=6.75 GHVO01007096.1:303-641(-)
MRIMFKDSIPDGDEHGIEAEIEAILRSNLQECRHETFVKGTGTFSRHHNPGSVKHIFVNFRLSLRYHSCPDHIERLSGQSSTDPGEATAKEMSKNFYIAREIHWKILVDEPG